MAKTLTSTLPDALSSKDALQTLLDCPWATQVQRKVFQEGKLAPTDPPATAETCLQTIRLVDGQLTVYTDGSASAVTKDGGAGLIMTRGDPADPTILHQSHLREPATLIAESLRQPPRPLRRPPVLPLQRGAASYRTLATEVPQARCNIFGSPSPPLKSLPPTLKGYWRSQGSPSGRPLALKPQQQRQPLWKGIYACATLRSWKITFRYRKNT